MENLERKFVGLAAAGLLLYLLIVLKPVLSPFLFAALIAYLANPLTDKLEKLKLPRVVAVIITFIVVLLVVSIFVLVLIPIVGSQVSALTAVMPDAISWLEAHVIVPVSKMFNVSEKLELSVVREMLTAHWQKAGNVALSVTGLVSKSGKAFLMGVTNVLLIFVVTFYLLCDWGKVVAGFEKLLPRKHAPVIGRLAKECNAVLGEFFRGQLMVMFGLAAIYCIGLWLVGIKLALILGLLSGIVSFVPYLGLIIGMSLSLVMAVLQFGTLSSMSWVVVVFVVGQMLEGTVLTPLFVGDRIGLHPVAVIFSVLAGAQLLGFVGVLMALPVAAMLMVIIRYANDNYQNSQFYKG